MTDDLNLSMFRAYDVRTPSSLLPLELSERLARAEAWYFRKVLDSPGVVVAHDARLSGPSYLQQAAQIYSQAGLDVVWIPGAVSASLFYFSAMKHPNYCGIMFGASHNPAGDTGRKVLGPQVRPIAKQIGPEGGLDKIRDLYVQNVPVPSSTRRGRITVYDPMPAYVAYSMELAGVAPGGLAGTTVLHDYLNGAAGKEMMLAFHTAGADLTPLHFSADGTFPLGDPNPVKPDVVRHGLEVLRSGSYLLGTFFDGDGDRIDFYAGDGRYLSSSFVYAAVLPIIRQRFPRRDCTVFADLKSNPLAVMEMARCGVTVQVIRNGHSQIKQEMLRNPAVIGAVEESAHFYERFTLGSDGPFCTENTLYIALLVTRAWREDPGRFEALFEIQAQTSRAREWGYKFPSDELRAEALHAVEEHFESLGARCMRQTHTGLDLEATLMRRGIPFDIDADTRLSRDWLQVCHRVSQSENGLARWEVVGATSEIVAQAKQDIAEIVKRYGAGDEYKG
ncbi:MAG: phosphoglucomutase [Armatimonadota bacterium]